MSHLKIVWSPFPCYSAAVRVPTPFCGLSCMNQEHSLLPYLCKIHFKVESLI